MKVYAMLWCIGKTQLFQIIATVRLSQLQRANVNAKWLKNENKSPWELNFYVLSPFNLIYRSAFWTTEADRWLICA